MAVSAVDEAVRNAVAVGADPDRLAILDNFCWGNPTFPDRLGSLVRTCQGCYDAALAYRTPFISGKDSLYNEFNGSPIPGTLLISAIGIVPDIERTVTSDLKAAGQPHLPGRRDTRRTGWFAAPPPGRTQHWHAHPRCRPTRSPATVRCMAPFLAGLVQSAHDLSEGGLAVALAEMCIAGRLGAQVTLDPLLGGARHRAALTARGAVCRKQRAPAGRGGGSRCRRRLKQPWPRTWVAPIGTVSAEAVLSITAGGTAVMDLPVDQLVQAWKREAA